MMLHINFKTSIRAACVLFLATLAGIPPAAVAQTSSTPAPAAKAAPTVSRVESRIKSMHSALHITAAQEPQWQAFAEVMRDNAKTTGALIQERMAKANTMNAVDDLRAYGAIADAHAAGLKKLTSSFETLYNSLSDTQKKDADTLFRRRPRAPQAKKSS